MRIKSISVKSGIVQPSDFLSKFNEVQEENTRSSFISSILILILLYVLKYITFTSFAVIDTIENDITYWKFEVPWWIQGIFTIMTTFYIIKVVYFYRKYKEQ